jgi:hypothetical protein
MKNYSYLLISVENFKLKKIKQNKKMNYELLKIIN